MAKVGCFSNNFDKIIVSKKQTITYTLSKKGGFIYA
jgi:hypothetical protein